METMAQDSSPAIPPVADQIPLAAPAYLPYAKILETLAQSSSKQKKPCEYFRSIVDMECITPETWNTEPMLNDLEALAQQSPSFLAFDTSNIDTHACLAVTDQPGPVLVANSNSTIGSFRVQLLPHPWMPAQALQTWKVSALKVSMIHLANSVTNGASKKRKRAGSSNNTPSKSFTAKKTTLSIREFIFDKLDISIADITLPPSGSQPVRLEFSCMVMDPLGRTTTYKALSLPFTVTSNCNQWKFGLGICLRHHIFPGRVQQAPFARFFNVVQLMYLATKAFPEARYLEPGEMMGWLLDCATLVPGMQRDHTLLTTHGVVTSELFEAWFDGAGAIIYDLHTCNVGKLFQKLWAEGFVGIGTKHPESILDSLPGHCRLSINTTHLDMRDRESYLVLQSSSETYALLSLERDQLAYFFEHSRHSQHCTHLISAVDNSLALPIESVFATKPSQAPSSSLLKGTDIV